LILVGNGTGIAGLRALLKARMAAGHARNWLLFGERTRAHDLHYRDEIAAWQAQGVLPHLDLAFSRDQAHKVYVQDLLRTQAARLREWMDDGAALYVCGSLHGMAPGVDAVLQEVFGLDQVERWAAEGRYRRDVY
jgi:sulfite reductase (NADPH) flavoprotein alpha-component